MDYPTRRMVSLRLISLISSTEVWSKNSSFSDLKIAHDILFTTSTIWQYPEVYEDEIQEWIEYATGKRIMNADRRAINRFVKKMCLTRRNVRMTCWIVFARNTANSSHLSPEEWNENKASALYNVYCSTWMLTLWHDREIVISTSGKRICFVFHSIPRVIGD